MPYPPLLGIFYEKTPHRIPDHAGFCKTEIGKAAFGDQLGRAQDTDGFDSSFESQSVQLLSALGDLGPGRKKIWPPRESC